MSLSLTPPNEAEASSISSVGENTCNVCSTGMAETDNCLRICRCNHSFHRTCIENFLSNTAECKKPCDLGDLQRTNAVSKAYTQPKPNVRGRGRGAATMSYYT